MKQITVIFLLLLSFFGIQAQDKLAPQERKAWVKKVFAIMDTSAANPAWLESKEYRKFKRTLLSRKALRLSGADYLALFKSGRHDLPFTHFDLFLENDGGTAVEPGQRPAKIQLDTVDARTVVLDINTFIMSAAPMLDMIGKIQAGGHTNLILDLRGNTGGSLDAAVVLGQYLTREPIDAGVYLTRKWYDQHEAAPTADEIKSIPLVQNLTYAGFMGSLQTNGAARMVIPGHDREIFTGKVYVLIDGATGSTCEPLVYLLREKGIATVVGESTFGGMLTGKSFPVKPGLEVFVPVADYYTAEGKRIDRVGVAPEVKVPASEALSWVLQDIQRSGD